MIFEHLSNKYNMELLNTLNKFFLYDWRMWLGRINCQCCSYGYYIKTTAIATMHSISRVKPKVITS